jgi:hypothetical protein
MQSKTRSTSESRDVKTIFPGNEGAGKCHVTDVELANRQGRSGVTTDNHHHIWIFDGIAIGINIISEISAKRLSADKFTCSQRENQSPIVSSITGSSRAGVVSDGCDRHEKAALMARLDLLARTAASGRRNQVCLDGGGAVGAGGSGHDDPGAHRPQYAHRLSVRHIPRVVVD